MTPRRVLALVMVLALGATGAVLLSRAHRSAGPPVLTVWFDQTLLAVVAQGPQADAAAGRTWALAWWAADRASAGQADGAYADAAVATAVHDVLVALSPTRRPELDAALAASPDDPAGARAGREQAAAVLAERTGDGLTPAELQGPATLPAPGPGVWRPTPPGLLPAAEVGLAHARPFLLSSPSQLRPPPPPGPGSPAYRRDLAEVRELGRVDSARRTPEQTAVALYWGGSELDVQVRVLQQLLLTQDLGTVAGTRLLSAFHRITVDAEIAVFDAKYAYASWRPVTALRVDGDGDPATPQVPGWTPLLDTPAHPDYPSAHTVYAGAAATVLEALVGPGPRRPLQVRSGGATRTYSRWQQLVAENEDARVWAGIHLRGSDAAGTALGRQVAAYELVEMP